MGRYQKEVIDIVTKQKVILKHREGLSNRQIARELGIDKNTVNKYVNEYEAALAGLLAQHPETSAEELHEYFIEKPRYSCKNRGPKTSTMEAMKTIQYCLEENEKKRQTGRSKQQMKKTDIHAYLIKQGFDISYSTVKRLANQLGSETRSKEAFIGQSYQPGDICEFDWGEVKLDIDGTGYKRYQMAVFSSALGNYRFARLYRTQDTAAFQDAHTEFFHYCHGVYHTVVYDNMKVAVKKFVGHSEKEPTDALVELSTYYGFQYRFCNVRRGNEKGHVERSVDVIRRFAFAEPGNDVFSSLEEANQHLLKMCNEKNALPLSDGRIPELIFQQEQKYLMCELPKMPCFMKRCSCAVDKYATVVINHVHYSVPDTLVGKKLDARIYTDTVVIYQGDTIVAKHSRCFRQGAYILDIYHYLRTLKRKPGALPQSTALMQSDTKIKNIYHDHYTNQPKEFLEVLEIIKDFGVDQVQQAMENLNHKLSQPPSADMLRQACACELDTSQIGTDKLSTRSKDSLSLYDKLLQLQNTEKEVV